MEGESMSEWKEVRLGDYIEFNPYRKLRKGDKAKKITMDMLIPTQNRYMIIWWNHIMEAQNSKMEIQ